MAIASANNASCSISVNIDYGGNLLSANQASLETDATGWAAVSNSSVARSTTQSLAGAASLAMTVTGAGSAACWTDFIAVTGGKAYLFDGFARAGSTSRSIFVTFYWYTSGQAFIGTSVASGGVADSSSAWTQFRWSVSAPINAGYVHVVLSTSGGAASEIHYFDQMVLSGNQVSFFANAATVTFAKYADAESVPVSGTANSATITVSPQVQAVSIAATSNTASCTTATSIQVVSVSGTANNATATVAVVATSQAVAVGWASNSATITVSPSVQCATAVAASNNASESVKATAALVSVTAASNDPTPTRAVTPGAENVAIAATALSSAISIRGPSDVAGAAGTANSASISIASPAQCASVTGTSYSVSAVTVSPVVSCATATASANNATLSTVNDKLIFLDNFTRTLTTLAGSVPDMGTAWTDTSTNSWGANGTEAYRNAASGYATAGATQSGDFSATWEGLRFSTVGAKTLYFFSKYVNTTNLLTAYLDVSAGGVVTFGIYSYIASVVGHFSSTTTTGIPGSTNPVGPYDLTFTISGVHVRATINGVALTFDLTSGEASSLASGDRVGMVATGTPVTIDRLFAVVTAPNAQAGCAGVTATANNASVTVAVAASAENALFSGVANNATVLTTEYFSTLYDDFNDNSIDVIKWGTYGLGVAEAGQQMQFTSQTSAQYSGWGSNKAFNLTGSQVILQLVDMGDRAITSLEVYPIQLFYAGNNQLNFALFGTDLKSEQRVAGVTTTLATETYSAVNHAWLRIREASGTTYWERSADGNTWVTVVSASNPIAVTALKHETTVGTWQAEVSTTVVKFDNFNVVSLSPAAENVVVTGTAYPTTIKVSPSVQGVAPTATPNDASVSIKVTSESVAVTGTANDATVTRTGRGDAQYAAISAASKDAQISVKASVESVAVAGAAQTPSVSISVSPQNVSVTATAYGATVTTDSGSNNTNASSGCATFAGVANNASTANNVSAGNVAVSATSNNGSCSVATSIQSTAVSVTANNAQTSIKATSQAVAVTASANACQVTVSGAALLVSVAASAPTPSVLIAVTAGSAAITGTANDAAVTVVGSAQAQAVSITASALSASASIATSITTASATSTAVDAHASGSIVSGSSGASWSVTSASVGIKATAGVVSLTWSTYSTTLTTSPLVSCASISWVANDPYINSQSNQISSDTGQFVDGSQTEVTVEESDTGAFADSEYLEIIDSDTGTFLDEESLPDADVYAEDAGSFVEDSVENIAEVSEIDTFYGVDAEPFVDREDVESGQFFEIGVGETLFRLVVDVYVDEEVVAVDEIQSGDFLQVGYETGQFAEYLSLDTSINYPVNSDTGAFVDAGSIGATPATGLDSGLFVESASAAVQLQGDESHTLTDVASVQAQIFDSDSSGVFSESQDVVKNNTYAQFDAGSATDVGQVTASVFTADVGNCVESAVVGVLAADTGTFTDVGVQFTVTFQVKSSSDIGSFTDRASGEIHPSIADVATEIPVDLISTPLGPVEVVTDVTTAQIDEVYSIVEIVTETDQSGIGLDGPAGG